MQSPLTIGKTPQSKCWSLAALLLFCCVAVVGLMTVGDQGKSWDEETRFESGDYKLSYYKALFSGEPLPDMRGDHYPGLFDLPLALAHERFPEWGTRSEKGHVWSLMFGILGLLSGWRLTARIGGERAGFWALLLLGTFPRYYGHMFFNPKDIPLAATYLAGVWALVNCFSQLPRPTWQAIIIVGIASGFALSTRVAGLLILCYLALFALLYLISKYTGLLRSGQGFSISIIPKDCGYWLLRGVVAGLIAFCILMVFWPTTHGNPFSSVGSTLETVQHVDWNGYVLMEWFLWPTMDLPPYYIPYWILVTTPVAVLVLFSIAAVLGLLSGVSYLRRGSWPIVKMLWPRLLLAFAFIFPLIYLWSKDPVLYDGLRHFLFILPPMVCIAALGLEWLLKAAERSKRKRVCVGLQVGVGFSVLLVIMDLVSLHPYQYVYFNNILGGLKGAYLRYETDYWGLSNREAGEWLNVYVDEVAPYRKEPFKVFQRYSNSMLEPFLSERFTMTTHADDADFYVAITRYDFHTRYPHAAPLYVVERQGVPLCFISQFRPILGPAKQ
jgi:hypothetical protein